MRIAIAAGSVATLLFAHQAHAAQCGSVTLDDQAQDVIIGEAGYTDCFPDPFNQFCPDDGVPLSCCYFVDYQAPTLGICWKDSSGVEHLDIVNCTHLTASTDYFLLSTRGGDDRVAVLKDHHTTGFPGLLPAFRGTGAKLCGTAGDAIAPWHPDWVFTMNVYLGTGTDLFHGSENRDFVQTNATWFIGGSLHSPADNSSDDEACGWGGNDVLYGDEDDNFSAGFEDRLDGGAGTDICDGDYIINGSDTSDLHRNCENASDAFSDVGIGEIDCSASDDPLHDW